MYCCFQSRAIFFICGSRNGFGHRSGRTSREKESPHSIGISGQLGQDCLRASCGASGYVMAAALVGATGHRSWALPRHLGRTRPLRRSASWARSCEASRGTQIAAEIAAVTRGVVHGVVRAAGGVELRQPRRVCHGRRTPAWWQRRQHRSLPWQSGERPLPGRGHCLKWHCQLCRRRLMLSTCGPCPEPCPVPCRAQ